MQWVLKSEVSHNGAGVPQTLHGMTGRACVTTLDL